MAETEESSMRKIVCDFCGEPLTNDKSYKSYACQDFGVQCDRPDSNGFYRHINFLGAWLACPECSKLIDADQWGVLIDKLVASPKFPGNGESKRKFLVCAYAGFRQYRIRAGDKVLTSVRAA